MTKANYSRLRDGLEEALAHVRGEETGIRVQRVAAPDIQVKSIRKKLGLTQEQMAALLGTSKSGYQKWEQGKRCPRGAALMLLKVADKEPDAVLRALTAA